MNENNTLGGAPAPANEGATGPISAGNLHGGQFFNNANPGTGQVAEQPSAVTPTIPGVNPVVSNPMDGAATLGNKGSAKKSVIDIVILVVVSLIAVAGIICSVLFYLEWDKAKTNVEGKINAEVAAARAEQQELDETNFAEREKQPNLVFTGPSDYGSLSFMYPRTWSVHIAKDASNGGDFEAYLHPGGVNPVGNSTINALRVTILDRPIEQVRKNYDAQVKSGKLTMSVFQVGNITGDRYDGEFNRDIKGSMVMIKINDKTALVRTDADLFRTDFEALIATIRLN